MAQFFIRRPVVAMVISILIVLVGVVALTRLPVANYPELSPPNIQVSTLYPGASAEIVEQSVATPIEQQVNGVEGMLYLRSVNSSDGRMSLGVTFEVGRNGDIASMLTQNRVSQAQSRLPQDVIAQGVVVRKQNPSILLVVSLFSPKGTYDALFLNNFAVLNVRESLLRVEGVSEVNLAGGAEYGMRIWLRPDTLASLQLTPADVIAALREQNIQAPAGQIGAAPSRPDQEFTYSVRAPSRLATPEEFGNVMVRTTPDGRIVRVRDVARVEMGAEAYRSFGRMNGQPAAVLLVYMLPDANQIATADGVYERLRQLKQTFPADIDYAVTYDTTPAVRSSIESILHTLLEALGLVILVVFLFLQNWRATLIPLLAIPVSLLGTFAFFPAFGFSVNTLTLFGMVLAIGIVVDDAIVVVEAVMRHIEEGLAPRDATVRAMQEVSGPVIGIALVLSSVFIPVAFLGGLTGRLYQQFALTIAIAVVISAFTALSLSPALSAIFLRPPAKRGGWFGRFFGGFNRVFQRTTNGYLRGAALLARRALWSLLILAVVSLGAGSLFRSIPRGFIPEEDQGILLLNVQLPNAASLERTDEVLRRVEAILSRTPGVQSYNVVGGFSIIGGGATSYSASCFVRLRPWAERDSAELSLPGIIGRLSGQLAAIPDAVALAIAPPSLPGFGAAGGFSFVLQDRSGTMSVQELGANVQAFMNAARQRPELARMFTAFDPNVPQLQLRVDREKARTFGVPLTDVYETLQALLGGAFVNDFNRFGRLYRVFVQADAEYRQRPSDIGRFYVRSATTNAMIPLSTLVTITPSSGAEMIVRYNLYRAAEITGAAAEGYSSGEAMQALQAVAAQALPRGMGHEFTGLSYQEQQAPSPVPTFALAVVFVFLLLAALYESWSLPWSVLLGTPLVALGALFGVWLRDFDNNVFVQIGLVMLIGLAAKNAILIVEFAKVRKEQGKPSIDAALEAARLRFRPILMTAFAFILGVVPLMLASGSGANARQIMGTAVFWGMLVATALGVFLTPAFFVVVESVRERWRRRRRSLPLIALGAWLLGGCKVGPDYRRPDVPVPAEWRFQTPAAGNIADLPWWDFFQDPTLIQLLAIGLANNHDIRIAIARIEQARGAYRGQRSGLFPTVDAAGTWTRSRALGNQFDLSGLLSYEVDIWGRVRRLTEAARAELLAAEETRRTVYLGLLAQIATAYLDLRALDEQLAISRRTVGTRRKSLELTKAKFDNGRGIVSELDVRQAETLLYGAQATVADFERLIALRENELRLLTGRNPGAIERGAPLEQQRLVEQIPAGLPSELLLRRPDIRAAEQRLIAANANIGAARAAYFPTISLTAALGLQSNELRDLFDLGPARTWRFAPQVVAPLFNAGRIRGGVTIARAQREEAIVAYEQAIQSAFREVEDALISIQKLGEQLAAQEQTVAAERARLELAELRYEAGVADYIEVLDAQRFLFTAELNLAEVRNARLAALVQLYRALGGGWQQ